MGTSGVNARLGQRLAVVGVAAAVLLAACSSAPAPATSTPGVEASPVSTPSVSPAASPSPATSPSAGASEALPGEPDPALTPGATNPAVTQATIGSTICISGWTATVRPPSSYTTALKVEQIPEYAYADTSLADYEEDHLVSLEIGGAPSDPRNLWPEPYTVSLSDGRPVGARVKDQLENRLHDLVCAGQMTLVAAQEAIATDWIGTWFELTGQAPPPGGSAGPGATASVTPSATPGATLAPGSTISVRFTGLTSPVARGGMATATVATLPGANCSIEVIYKSGPSGASGLVEKTASASGVASWSWRVGTRTTVGTWPVIVTCSSGDASASATKSFRVT